MKTSELTGAALDWAVAHAAKSANVVIRNGELGIPEWVGGDYNGHNSWTRFHPSTSWAQGGLIIEREKIDTYYSTAKCLWAAAIWKDIPGGGQLEHKQTDCPTPLIAAMRCFVASKLGDEVDVPKELL